jgi:signal peptidase II
VQPPVPYREHTFLYITHERNPGLVGGHFAGSRLIALAAPILATLALVFLYKHLNPRSRLQSIAYGLIGGGAIGNLIDRIVRGEVVDFIQVHFYFVPFDFPWKFWPAFNIADMGICTGVFLLIATWHKSSRAEESNAPHSV